MLAQHSSSKPWILVDAAVSIVRPFGAAAVLFGLISFVGYAAHIEELYRPFPNGPATNPQTATVVVLIGLSLLVGSASQRAIWLQRTFATLALLVAGTRIFDALFQTQISQSVMPFHHLVLEEIAQGKSNSFGVNSALMLAACAAAVWFKAIRQQMLSQLAASLAFSIPMITFIGYSYQLSSFYGEMSLLTATAGFTLSLSALALSADFGVLKSILSPYIAGKVARYQVVVGYLFPILIGYFLVNSFLAGDTSILGMFVVIVCWFIVLMVGVSAIFVERVDRSRREMESKLIYAAYNDKLTALPNRRKFFDAGEHELTRARRSDTRLCVMMLDIDYFKSINDKAGHAIGDKVLIEIAKTLKATLRDVDVVGRIGGEEFAVILADTNSKGAGYVAEKLRRNVEGTEVEGWTDIYGPVTTSIGWTTSRGEKSLDECLSEADKALYHSKENGRNQVIAFSDLQYA